MYEVMKEEARNLKKSRERRIKVWREEVWKKKKCYYIKISVKEFSIMEFYYLTNNKGSDNLNYNFLMFSQDLDIKLILN